VDAPQQAALNGGDIAGQGGAQLTPAAGTLSQGGQQAPAVVVLEDHLTAHGLVRLAELFGRPQHAEASGASEARRNGLSRFLHEQLVAAAVGGEVIKQRLGLEPRQAGHTLHNGRRGEDRRQIIYLAGGSEERETAQTQALNHLVSRLDLKVTKLLKFVFSNLGANQERCFDMAVVRH